jgi:hypothetical protein
MCKEWVQWAMQDVCSVSTPQRNSLKASTDKSYCDARTRPWQGSNARVRDAVVAAVRQWLTMCRWFANAHRVEAANSL